MTTSLLVHQMMAGFLSGTSESLPMEVRFLEGKYPIYNLIDLERIHARQGRENLFIWESHDGESWRRVKVRHNSFASDWQALVSTVLLLS